MSVLVPHFTTISPLYSRPIVAMQSPVLVPVQNLKSVAEAVEILAPEEKKNVEYAAEMALRDMLHRKQFSALVLKALDEDVESQRLLSKQYFDARDYERGLYWLKRAHASENMDQTKTPKQ